jgi:hypothetical protein
MDLREYMVKPYEWENNVPEKIWWDVHWKSINYIKINKRRIIQRFIHKKLPCNYRQNMCNDYKPSFCGACKTPIETQDHILQCPQYLARKLLRHKYRLEFNLIMGKYTINPTITKIITHKASG